MGLLAYEEPEKSPMVHLLSLDYRQQVADCLNRAILGLFLDFLYAATYHVLGCSEDLCLSCNSCKDHLLVTCYCYKYTIPITLICNCFSCGND